MEKTKTHSETFSGIINETTIVSEKQSVFLILPK